MFISISCFVSIVTVNLILNLECASSNPAKITARVLVIQDRSVEDGYKVEIESNGEKRELQLTPLDSIWSDVAQVLKIKRSEEGEKIFERSAIPKSKIYHDEERGSFLSIKEEKVNGILDSEYMIRSEGESHFISRSTFNEENPFKNDYIIPREIPIKYYPSRQNFRNDYIIPEENTTKPYPSEQNFEMNSSSNYRSGSSYTAEVAVIVDSKLSSLLGSDQELYDYITIFWNGVNARFATIDSPKISIRLVGCFIIRNPEDEPFITKNKVQNDYLFGPNTLYDAAEWINKNIDILPDHDLIYVQAGLDLIDSDGSTGLAGIAFVGGACRKTGNFLINSEPKTLSIAVGLGQDVKGMYKGVNTAAHELAHNLGAPHDNDTKSGTGDCPWDEGYIMSYKRGSINEFFFSSCSKDKMAKYLAHSVASCTTENLSKTKPDGAFTSSKLPGQMITMDEQCKEMMGQSNSSVYANVNPESELCYNLKCYFYQDGHTWIATTFTAAAEGSQCPSGKHCKDGQCI